MTGAPSTRGPSGVAPPPPAWLAAADLPIDVIASGTTLYRVHRQAYGPLFFGPGPGRPATWRFDSASGAFGVLYLGLGMAGALVETLLRNPARKMVDYGELAVRALTPVHSRRNLRVVRLHGTGLQQVGCDNSISTGPYDVCGQWSDALWSHRSAPDGLAWCSRHNPEEICLALFERPNFELVAGRTAALPDMLPAVAHVLGAHGKSICLPSP